MGNTLTLAVDNTPLSEEESKIILKKANVVGKIICLCNQAETIKKDYNQKYVDAVMSADTDKIVNLTPYLVEWGGKIAAYQECISLIMEGI